MCFRAKLQSKKTFETFVAVTRNLASPPTLTGIVETHVSDDFYFPGHWLKFILFSSYMARPTSWIRAWILFERNWFGRNVWDLRSGFKKCLQLGDTRCSNLDFTGFKNLKRTRFLTTISKRMNQKGRKHPKQFLLNRVLTVNIWPTWQSMRKFTDLRQL